MVTCRPTTSQIKDQEGNKLLNMVVKDALLGQQLRELIKDSLKESLKSNVQGFILADLTMPGMEVSGVGSFLNHIGPSMHETNLGATFYQDIVMLGVNENLHKRKLDSIVISRVQDLLGFGHLEDTLMESVTTVKQSFGYDELAVESILSELESRQLDDIFLDIFGEVLQTGDLDDILMSAARETLESGNMDAKIKRIISSFLFPVST